MKRRHFRLIVLLCLILFVCGNFIGCSTESPNGSIVNPPHSSEQGAGDSEADDKTEGENGDDNMNDNPFFGGLVNGGSYEGN